MHYLAILIFELVILYYLSRRLTNRLWLFFYRLTKSKKMATYIYSTLFLPGILLHELAHFLTALFLLVPVGRLNFNPVFDYDEKGNIKEIKLGSVAIGKAGLIRGTLIGLAPFIFGILLIIFTIYFVNSKDLISNWMVVLSAIYIIFEIGNTMFLSRSDIKTAVELTLVVLVFYIILCVFGIRVGFNSQGLFTQDIIEVLKTADKFLLLPLAIDFIVFCFTPRRHE